MVHKMRTRWSKEDIRELRAAIVEIVEQHRPLTIRHLFYLMVAGGFIAKSEDEYRNVVVRLAGEMREEWLAREELLKLFHRQPHSREDDDDYQDYADRRDKLFRVGDLAVPVIPFGREHIVDAGRWVRKPRTHSGIQAALRDTAEVYRRAVWDEQDHEVHVFCEKDAIADLVNDATEIYDIPLAVMRGDASKTFLYECAAAIEEQAKPATLYFLGDYDVKGQQIIQSAFERLRRYAPSASIAYEILAVTEEQIEQYALPTRPEKSDASREAVEIDALPPAILRQLITGAIESHLPQAQLDILRVAEASQRAILTRIANLPDIESLLNGREQ
jgi:hypothetical protein